MLAYANRTLSSILNRSHFQSKYEHHLRKARKWEASLLCENSLTSFQAFLLRKKGTRTPRLLSKSESLCPDDVTTSGAVSQPVNAVPLCPGRDAVKKNVRSERVTGKQISCNLYYIINNTTLFIYSVYVKKFCKKRVTGLQYPLDIEAAAELFIKRNDIYIA